ncbi:MAG: disulfide bond formation protein DsbA [Hyphomicrobiales bacterium]|nr:MAG: disulfide bond formation protein DsbA [Hyphomicrobiales bacterium]
MIHVLRAAAVAFAVFAIGVPAASAQSVTPEQRSEFETIIRDYLVSNPEVIEEAIAALQKKRADAEDAERAATISKNSDLLFNSTRQVVLGNPKGDVTLVEFFDYNCGYCKRAFKDMVRLLHEDSNLRIVLKEFPVLGQGSAEAAQVAIAVKMTDEAKYAAFHQEMLTMKGRADRAASLKAAEKAGLDIDAVTKNMESDEVSATIEEVYAMANDLGLTGTPSYVVGNEVLVGAVGYDQLKSKIKSIRACGETSC